MKETGPSQSPLPAPWDTGWAEGLVGRWPAGPRRGEQARDILRDIREEQASTEGLGGRARSHTSGGGYSWNFCL